MITDRSARCARHARSLRSLARPDRYGIADVARSLAPIVGVIGLVIVAALIVGLIVVGGSLIWLELTTL